SLAGGSSILRMTKVTDPAGRWKKSGTDPFGDLREVFEPKPAGGTYQTSYTYTSLGQLAMVYLQRDGWSSGVNQTLMQTRSFVYNNDGSLQSVTHPETGVKTFTYGNGKVIRQYDKLNQSIAYDYDATTQRLTTVRQLSAAGVEDTAQRVGYTYDSIGRV